MFEFKLHFEKFIKTSLSIVFFSCIHTNAIADNAKPTKAPVSFERVQLMSPISTYDWSNCLNESITDSGPKSEYRCKSGDYILTASFLPSGQIVRVYEWKKYISKQNPRTIKDQLALKYGPPDQIAETKFHKDPNDREYVICWGGCSKRQSSNRYHPGTKIDVIKGKDYLIVSFKLFDTIVSKEKVASSYDSYLSWHNNIVNKSITRYQLSNKPESTKTTYKITNSYQGFENTTYVIQCSNGKVVRLHESTNNPNNPYGRYRSKHEAILDSCMK